MGYRSDVGAMFYTPDKDKVGVVKMWLRENLPFDDWNAEEFDELEDGFRFYVQDIKWYDSYGEVQRFNEVVDKFKKLFCYGDEDNEYGAFEFVRIGEESADVEEFSAGDSDYRISVSKEIQFD